ncbi:MAG: Fur family transcriptional regulator [bacterium]|nr:Fur family transcriptional regulator [bacterium]
MQVSRVRFAFMQLSAQLLQQSQLKVTNARKVAIHFFEKEERPVDVEEILFHLRKHKLATDRATVYRMIDTFLDRGIITRLEFGEGKYRYELAGSDHHHLVCENCGRVEDISDCGIEAWEKKIKQKKHFLVKHHSLEFFGICKSCQ